MSDHAKITPFDELMELSDEQLTALYNQIETDPNPQFALEEKLAIPAEDYALNIEAFRQKHGQAGT